MRAVQDRYVVIGHPIAHSKSPLIHQLFAEQTQQALSYSTLLAPLSGFANTLQTFIDEGGKGCNVTLPFKQEAWQAVRERSLYAEKAGAVNTIKVTAEGSLYGHNTDGLGLVRDLQVNKQVNLMGRRILVLGAGGAVRGVLQPLAEANPACIVIVNRTAAKAQALAAAFGEQQIWADTFEHLTEPFDVVINGTSASLNDEVPPLPPACVQAGSVCYDMMYAKQPTAFMRWATQQGVEQVYDGLGMLIEQAAEAFQLWRGIRPDTAPVFATLSALS